MKFEISNPPPTRLAQKMGTLSQRIHQDIKSAMIRRDHLRRNALRLLKSALDYAALKSGKEDLSDLEVIRIIQKEVKKRKEAREQFLKGGRAEQADQEQQELHILETYLPKPFTEEELRTAVQTAISELDAASKKDIGIVIRAVQSTCAGRADGKAISQMVGNLLS